MLLGPRRGPLRKSSVGFLSVRFPHHPRCALPRPRGVLTKMQQAALSTKPRLALAAQRSAAVRRGAAAVCRYKAR